MGRSKKNWDHLVDYFGNYGIDIANGIFPGSGNTPGVKGNKGEIGFDGQKGDEGIKGGKGDRGYGQKGDKGKDGPDGEKGSKGEARGLLTFKGSVPDAGSLPSDALPGDVYLQTDTDVLMVWTGSDWEEFGANELVKGEKGEDGDLGLKGEPGVDGLQGAGGPDGDKGEKGDNYDPLVLDDYYDKGQIDGLIEYHQAPEFAFNVNYYKDDTSIVSNETVDFESTDQQDELYNPGIVHIEPNCTIVNSPLAESRQIVVNYVIDDSGRARGLGYQMIQHVYSPNNNAGEQDAYYRVVRPGQSEFGEWRLTHFDSDRYYTKVELDARIGNQSLTLVDGAVDNTETIGLLDANGAIGASVVRIRTQGGITLTRNNNTLTFDGSPLAGQLQFLGLIETTEDANTLQPSASAGQYFIFKNSGTDTTTGEDVNAGDWLIYGEDPATWRHLPMDVNYGVAEVRLKADEPYLTETGTIQFPELAWDKDLYDTSYPGSIGSSSAINGSLFEARDVDHRWGAATLALYNTRVSWSETLVAQGSYSINFKERKLKLSSQDMNGNDVSDFDNEIALSEFIGVYAAEKYPEGSTEGEVASTSLGVDGLTITFKDTRVLVAMAYESNQFSVYAVKSRNIQNGNSLLWNDAAEKFVAGEAGDGVFVRKAGDTMEGALDMDGKDLHGLANPPAQDSSAASKEWVLSLLSGLVQPGMVVFWPSAKSIPSGWMKCDGGGYDVANNPKMHAVLADMEGFVSGKMPNWKGHFLYHTYNASSTANVNGGAPGHKSGQRTANSSNGITISGGKHQHKWKYKAGTGSGTSTGSSVLRPEGSGAKNNNSVTTYYTIDSDTSYNGSHSHSPTGFDSKTRPDAVAGYWIMKMD